MRYLLTLSLLIASITLTNAQTRNFQRETFGTRDGMQSPKIFTLMQDSDHLLWIGTEIGISRYNGYEFENFQYSNNDEPIGRILCITQDSLKNIWLGGDKGLFCMNNDTIRQFHIKGRSSIAVESLLTDARGNVWIGEVFGLYQLTISQLQKISQSGQSLDLHIFQSFKERVFSLASDRFQNIYIGSFDGVFMLDQKKNNTTLIWKNPDPGNGVRSVQALSPDSIYFNRINGHNFSMLHGQVTEFVRNDFAARNIFRDDLKAYALTTSTICEVTQTGLKAIINFTNLANNATSALIDREGNFWIGTWEGLFKYRRSPFEHYFVGSENSPEIFSMLESANGLLYFGGNHGFVFTIKDRKLIQSHLPLVFSAAEVFCMYEHTDNSFWFGSGYQGISRYKNLQFARWTESSGLPDNNCESFYKTREGKLFACTEKGVLVIDPMLENPFIDHYLFENSYARYPELFGCFEGSVNNYFFYGSQGIFRLINKKLVRDSIHGMPIKSLHVNRIVQDKKQNIWIATQGKGLLQCRLEGTRLVLKNQLSATNGLLSDVVLSVIVDKKDNVWVGDHIGLTLLVNTNRMIHFNEKDGLLSSYYENLELQMESKGTIWGLSSRGAFSFHPDSIHLNPRPPTLTMNHIKAAVINVNEKNVQVLSPIASEAVLPYKKNSIQFTFTAISLTDAGKIRYAYRLIGADTNWRETKSRTVVFNFLQPGKYQFELRANNNSNVWTEHSAVFIFTIRPPFWQQWWFRLLVLVLATGIILWILRRRIQLIRRKAAIRQQMTELEAKALRAQMNPHFIFNCLNAIQELIVTQDVDSAYLYLSMFSKLLRLVLNNSEKDFISLADEIEMEQLYLELESLRFKRSFIYAINVDEKIETETTRVPSLLLQPFIENAIWHGLMNKEGEKELNISFLEKDNHIECVITDNGIGRAKARKIKDQQLGKQYFESKGTLLSEQRINILNQQMPEHFSIEIVDLVDSDGDGRGTKVTIILPYKTY